MWKRNVQAGDFENQLLPLYSWLFRLLVLKRHAHVDRLRFNQWLSTVVSLFMDCKKPLSTKNLQLCCFWKRQMDRPIVCYTYGRTTTRAMERAKDCVRMRLSTLVQVNLVQIEVIPNVLPLLCLSPANRVLWCEGNWRSIGPIIFHISCLQLTGES